MKKLTLLIMVLLMMPLKINAFNISSECMIVMEADSKRVLYSKNMDKPKLIASITKIMTAIIAIESNKLEDNVIVDEIIKKSVGSNLYIEVGEHIFLHDLIYGLMLRSGNDAALMISKHVAGSEKKFVKLMNQKAIQLGMKNTIFSNPSGLDNENENKSTAYDMALLTSYAMKNKTYRKIVKTKKYVLKTNYKTYLWYNKNKLLQYDFITGGKTGYTEKAKRTLVSSGMIDNMEVIIVTLNDGNDFVNHKNMYDNVFSKYKKYKLLNKNKLKIRDDFYKDSKMYIEKDFYYPIKENEKDNLYTKIKLEKKFNFSNHEKIGEILIYNKNKVIHIEPIYILKNKKSKGFFKW